MITPSSNSLEKHKLPGLYQLMAGAAMISFSAVFVKLAHVGPTASGFYRMIFGSILLCAVLLISRQKPRFSIKPMAIMMACGVFFAMDLILWHRSVFFVGPGLSTILANFQVFFLAGFGVFMLKEKLSLKYVLSIPMGFFGLFLIIGGDWLALDAQYKTGLLLGLLTALTYSAYLLSFRKLQSSYADISPFFTMAVISITAAVLLGIEMVAEKASFDIPDMQSWISLTAYGLFGQVLGWVLISRGIAKVEASRAGLILLLQPSLAFVWDVLLFNRPAGPIEIAGCILAISGIYLGSSVGKKN
ncbi:MAG: DMT family transporter [Proteobacteria bacterium]|nr:DMT family transporter [Pseudomonadota bacterium]